MSEKKLLRYAFVLSIILMLATLIVAVLSDSMILLLDAAFSFISVFITFLSLVVLGTIEKPADKKYHFGYAKFEPLTATFEGVLIVMVCVVTIFFSIQDLVNEDTSLHFILAIYFSFFVSVVSALVSFVMFRKSKTSNSQLLRANAEMWLFDALIGFGACLAFIAAYFISMSQWAAIAPYIDPSVAILFSLGILYKPVKLIWDNVGDLVDMNPGGMIYDQVQALCEQFKQNNKLDAVDYIRLRRAGRTIFVHVDFIVSPAHTMSKSQSHEDLFITEVEKALPNVDVSVSWSVRAEK